MEIGLSNSPSQFLSPFTCGKLFWPLGGVNSRPSFSAGSVEPSYHSPAEHVQCSLKQPMLDTILSVSVKGRWVMGRFFMKWTRGQTSEQHFIFVKLVEGWSGCSELGFDLLSWGLGEPTSEVSVLRKWKLCLMPNCGEESTRVWGFLKSYLATCALWH